MTSNVLGRFLFENREEPVRKRLNMFNDDYYVADAPSSEILEAAKRTSLHSRMFRQLSTVLHSFAVGFMFVACNRTVFCLGKPGNFESPSTRRRVFYNRTCDLIFESASISKYKGEAEKDQLVEQGEVAVKYGD